MQGKKPPYFSKILIRLFCSASEILKYLPLSFTIGHLSQATQKNKSSKHIETFFENPQEGESLYNLFPLKISLNSLLSSVLRSMLIFLAL